MSPSEEARLVAAELVAEVKKEILRLEKVMLEMKELLKESKDMLHLILMTRSLQ